MKRNTAMWRVAVNKQARRIMAMMHREDADQCKAMNRMAMMDKLDILRVNDHRLSDEMRVKILKRREKRVKSACIKLVRLGQLVSKRGKAGGQMYALPENRCYL